MMPKIEKILTEILFYTIITKKLTEQLLIPFIFLHLQTINRGKI